MTAGINRVLPGLYLQPRTRRSRALEAKREPSLRRMAPAARLGDMQQRRSDASHEAQDTVVAVTAAPRGGPASPRGVMRPRSTLEEVRRVLPRWWAICRLWFNSESAPCSDPLVPVQLYCLPPACAANGACLLAHRSAAAPPAPPAPPAGEERWRARGYAAAAVLLSVLTALLLLKVSYVQNSFQSALSEKKQGASLGAAQQGAAGMRRLLTPPAAPTHILTP